MAIAVALYTLAAPAIRQKTGWDLPTLRSGDNGIEVVDRSSRDSTSSADSVRDSSQPRDDAETLVATDGPLSKFRKSKNQSSAKGDAAAAKTDAGSADTSTATTTTGSKSVAGSKSPAGSEGVAESDTAGLLHGRLREIAPDRYISISGLMYSPGSAEGHRLEHLRRHTKDQAGRPGNHGVFDGGMDGAIKTIDLAYERAKKNQRTTKKTDRDRTIYTVDMGRRVGYVGGRDGNRRRKPMARRVRLVLEGNRFITAFPL